MTVVEKPDVKKLYSRLCNNLEEYIMFRIAKEVTRLTPELTEKGYPPIRMSIGAPTVEPPEALKNALKQALDEKGIHTYSSPNGEPYFRKAVVERMQKRFGVTLDVNREVCSLIGSKEGLAQMFRAIITPELNFHEREIILTPDPGYASYKDAIEVAGGHSYSMPLTLDNHYMPDFEAVYQQVKTDGYDPSKIKALILNYPSNPIGATCPLSYLAKAVEFGRKYNILVISDLAYAEMSFTGEEKPHSVLEVPGAMDIAIEFHSLSKPYATTGWRMGFAVGNADAVNILATLKSTIDSGIFKSLQKAAVFALTSPECDQFVADTNKIYEQNQAVMLDGFRQLGWPIDELNPPKATFYLWLPIPPRYLSCEAFTTELLQKCGIVAVPGTAFGKQGEGFMRLSLVNPLEELHEVIRRMDQEGFHYHA